MKFRWINLGAFLFGLSIGIGGWFGIVGLSICSAMMIYDNCKKRKVKEYEKEVI